MAARWTRTLFGSGQCDSINEGNIRKAHEDICKGLSSSRWFYVCDPWHRGLAALLLPSMGLLYLCGFSAVFLLVTPPMLALEYGEFQQVVLDRRGRATWKQT